MSRLQQWARRIATIAIASTAVSGGVVGVAHAAYPTCNTWEKVYYVHRYVKWPKYGATNSFDCIMGQGSASSAVSALQDTLKRCYGKAITVDGIFGSATRSALISVQSQEGITADGIYGPRTRSVLNWAEYDEYTNAFVGCEYS